MQGEQAVPAKAHATWLVWLLSFGTLALGMTQQYILGVPDQVAASAQVRLSDVSLMMTAFGVVNAIFAPLVIISTGRFTQRAQLIVGLAFAAVGLFLTAFSRSFAVLLVARGIMGVGNGVFVATAYSVAPKLSKPGHEGTAMANVALGFSAANLLAMPLARALRDFVDWHSAYFALGVVAVVLGFAILRSMPAFEGTSSRAGIRQRLSPVKDPIVLCALVGTFLEFAGYMAFYTYLTPYVDAAVPGIGALASVLLFVIGAMSIVGTKLCGLFTDKFGSRRTIVVGLIAQAGALVLAGLFARATGLVVVLLCVWGCVISMFVPAQNLFLTRTAGENAGMAVALSNSFLQLGNGIGGAVSGVAISCAPLLALPLLAMPITLLALVAELVSFAMLRRRNR